MSSIGCNFICGWPACNGATPNNPLRAKLVGIARAEGIVGCLSRPVCSFQRVTFLRDYLVFRA